MNESERKALARWVDDRIEAYLDDELPEEERRRFEAVVRQDEDAQRQLRHARLLMERLAEFERPACPPEVADAVLASIRAEEERGLSRERHASARRRPARRPAGSAAWLVSDRAAQPTRTSMRNADRPARQAATRMRRLVRPALAAALLAAALTAVFLAQRPPSLDFVAERTAEIDQPGTSPSDQQRAADAGTEQPGEHAEAADPRALAVNPPAADLQIQNAPAPAENEADSGGDEQASAARPALTSAEVQQALAEAKWALAYVSQVGRQTGRTIGKDVIHDRITEPMQEALGTAFDRDSNS